MPATRIAQQRWWGARVLAAGLVASGCSPRPAAQDAGAAVTAAPRHAAAGLFWGRVADVPDGMRVQVWLDSDGTRVRGGYSALPWAGDVEGRVVGDTVEAVLYERGISRAVGSRTRQVTLRWDAAGEILAGRDSEGVDVDFVRAGFASAALHPGVWMARWTGLPAGVAVETRLSRDPDDHWRAVYQYRGSGGVRDGSFDGYTDAGGALAITWREVAGERVSSGRGRLAVTLFGLRGTFGIEGSAEGTGEWTLEPLGR